MKKIHSRDRGSAVVWTVLTMVILSLLATEVLRTVAGRFQVGVQAGSWQQALTASEAGVDLAVVELRKSLYPAPNHAWEGWTTAPGNGVISHSLTTLPNAGMASTPLTIEVAVDAPANLVNPINPSYQYYRIRTLGSIPLTGPPRIAFNKQDNKLRKLTLRTQRFIDDIFTSETSAPHAARRIEAVVKPLSSFNQAILAVGALDFNNQNIVVDSYDSRDSTKSTNGLYDFTKRQKNGNIATDGTILDAGGAYVYGDVSTNSGTATGVEHVTGEQRTDFYQAPIPIADPSWSSINPSPSTITGTATINASPTQGSASSRYLLNNITLNSGNLTIAGAAGGSTTYIEIHVTGDITVTGNGQITVAPGVKATIYFDGNVNIEGNGIISASNQPGNLLLYGVQPAIEESAPYVKLGGNGAISAAIYAPGHDVTVKGGGSGGEVLGSVVGKTVTMNGVTKLHYDEALGLAGPVNNYEIASWFEDTR